MWHSGMEAFFGWTLVVLMGLAGLHWIYEFIWKIWSFIVQFFLWPDFNQSQRLEFDDSLRVRNTWFCIWTIVLFIMMWIVRNFI